MGMTDPIADLLTRLRNATRARHTTTSLPSSKLKKAVLEVLVNEGYLAGVQVKQAGSREVLEVHLKYGPRGEQVITELRRVSKPSRRVYQKASQVKPVLSGRGTAIISTSRGLMTDRQSRAKNLGGEVLCYIW